MNLTEDPLDRFGVAWPRASSSACHRKVCLREETLNGERVEDLPAHGTVNREVASEIKKFGQLVDLSAEPVQDEAVAPSRAEHLDDLEPVEGELQPAMAALLDPELPQKLQTQNTAYAHDPTGIDWDHVIDQINRADTEKAHGSKVPLMVGDTGFEPVTSAV